MTAAEYRQALASLETIKPTLERLLKAGADAAQMLETKQAQEQALTKNIAGLQLHEKTAQEEAQKAIAAAEAAKKAAEHAISEQVQRAEVAQASAEAAVKRLAELQAQVGAATRDLRDLRNAIEDSERRVEQAKARAARIAAAAEEAARS